MSSSCPACYVGLCKKHPLQDGGAALAAKGARDKGGLVAHFYDSIVGKQLAKARADAAARDAVDEVRVRALC